MHVDLLTAADLLIDTLGFLSLPDLDCMLMFCRSHDQRSSPGRSFTWDMISSGVGIDFASFAFWAFLHSLPGKTLGPGSLPGAMLPSKSFDGLGLRNFQPKALNSRREHAPEHRLNTVGSRGARPMATALQFGSGGRCFCGSPFRLP